MRINDYGPEYPACGHCQDSRSGRLPTTVRQQPEKALSITMASGTISPSPVLVSEGMGGQKVSATGKVYNLNTLHDFPGTYQGISGGLTLIEGKMHAKLTNGNGVVMYLAGQTEGLASSMGAQAFEVSLTD